MALTEGQYTWELAKAIVPVHNFGEVLSAKHFHLYNAFLFLYMVGGTKCF